MADEPATVRIEDGPATEQARASAELATQAAAAAIAQAAITSENNARAAAERVEEIAADTAEDLADQEENLQWLRDHARSTVEHQNATNQSLESLRTETTQLRDQFGTFLSETKAILSSLIPVTPATEENPQVIPPVIPPEGEAAPGDQIPKQKRRLI